MRRSLGSPSFPGDLVTANDSIVADVASFDVIVVNSSGGKDSQVALDVVVQHAAAAGVLDRVVVLYCELGRVEWPGTAELVRNQAAHYGIRFELRSRPQGDLLDHIERRRMFPSSTARYCTSDHKRAQGRKFITELVRELGLNRQARVLNVLGFRAEESPARLRRSVLALDEGASSGVREVWTWLPIHGWTEAQVWERIKKTGVPHHPAYDAGMSRLSCSFCVLASRRDLLTAVQLRPDLAAEYAALEERIGHRFTHQWSMAELIGEVGRAESTSG